MTAALYGLVLAGGASRRMGQDKAALVYDGRPQLARVFDLVSARVPRCFVSVRAAPADTDVRAAYPKIPDENAPDFPGDGPVRGLFSAHRAFPDVAWLVVACDLPMLDAGTLDFLMAARDGSRAATAFASEHDGLPEPLCTIWEPHTLKTFMAETAPKPRAPRRILAEYGAHVVAMPHGGALDNVNTPQERRAAMARLAAGAA